MSAEKTVTLVDRETTTRKISLETETETGSDISGTDDSGNCKTGCLGWNQKGRFCWIWVIIVIIILIFLIGWLVWWLFGYKPAPKPIPGAAALAKAASNNTATTISGNMVIRPANTPRPVTNSTTLTCWSDGDCRDGLVCMNSSTDAAGTESGKIFNVPGVCGAPRSDAKCTHHGHCGHKHYCHGSGNCMMRPIAGGGIFSPCKNNGDCQDHLFCNPPEKLTSRSSQIVASGHIGTCQSSGISYVGDFQNVILNEVTLGNVRLIPGNKGFLALQTDVDYSSSTRFSYDQNLGCIQCQNLQAQPFYLTIDEKGNIGYTEKMSEAGKFQVSYDNKDGTVFYVTDNNSNVSFVKTSDDKNNRWVAFADSSLYKCDELTGLNSHYLSFRFIPA